MTRMISSPLGREVNDLPFGGPGSGYRGHKGRKGYIGGSAPRDGAAPPPPPPSAPPDTSTYQIGITSARYWKSDAQVVREFAGFRDVMEKTPVNNLSIGLGRGAWEGGGEVTFVTQYTGNGEAIKALAKYAKLHNQDSVLVQRYTTKDDPEAQPQNRIEFGRALDDPSIKAIETALINAKFVGWTWVKRNGGATLMLTCVPQWGGDKAKHIAAVDDVVAGLSSVGYPVAHETRYVQVSVMERGNYDDYIR